MQVPYIDLRQQYRDIEAEVVEEVTKVFQSGAYVLGPAVKNFEERYAEFTETKYAIGVNSGTSALHLALTALGIGPGDEVIVPAMTFLATASAVEYTGAKPVLVDIDQESYCLDPGKIEAAITPRTKALMPVHLYGQSADMDSILAIAGKHGLKMVEDAAQAHGSKYNGKTCGSMGDIAGFSFYPGKNLGAYGEAGAVVTSDDKLAEKLHMLRDWGAKVKYQHQMKGFNYRMDGIQGAVLGVKLKYIDQWNNARIEAAKLYMDLLQDVEEVKLPVIMPYAKHVFHVFAIMADKRDELMKHLFDSGISVGIHYPTPIHLQECFRELDYRPGDFPVAENLACKELSLPIFPEITEEQIQRTVNVIKDCFKK